MTSRDRQAKMRMVIAALLASFTLIAVSGCNFPGLATPQDISTDFTPETATISSTEEIASTPPAEITGSTSGTSDEPPLSTIDPNSATVSPSDCTDKLRFISDVTAPDNTKIKPGEAFTKTWRIRNSGTCVWTTDYRIVFESGNIMGGPAGGVPLPREVPPDETIDVSVDLVAPTINGKYRGYWLLRNAAGRTFGYGDETDKAFWVQITVKPKTTP